MLLRQAILLLTTPPTPTIMATSTPPIEDSASSILSSAPATAVLDRAELEIGLQIPLEGSAVSITESTTRIPKRRMTLDGIELIEVLLPCKKTAFYWNYGIEYEAQQSGNGKKPRYWCCSLCKRTKTFGMTHSDHIRDHLRSRHSVTDSKPPSSNKSVLELQQHAPMLASQRTSNLSDTDRHTVLATKFQAALVAFIVVAQVAFSIVESKYFQALLCLLSDLVPSLLPTSHNTAKSWIMNSYNKKKLTIKRMVAKSRSKINISFDLWTSPNYYAMAAVVGHFISAESKVESVLLALRDIIGPHSGANIAATVLDVLDEYEITPDRLGVFTLDNATNNDTCLQAIGKAYGWSRNDWKRYRLRCFGHIINLVAQAFIFGAESELFEETLKAYERDIESGKTKLWELRGPIGKLHFIVAYIRKTPQRRQEFARPGDGIDPPSYEPKQDNATRWNSVYQMIKRALQLKDHMDYFCYNNTRKKGNDDGLLEAQLLTSDDWSILQQMNEALAIFEDATMRLQGRAKDARFGAMWEVLPLFEDLIDQLVDLQRRYPLATTFEHTALDDVVGGIDPNDAVGADPATEFMCESINCAYTKLQKYYLKIDDSIYYIAGYVLHPATRWKALEDEWEDQPQTLHFAKDNMKKLWLQYKPSDPPASDPPASSNHPTTTAATYPLTAVSTRLKEDDLTQRQQRWRQKEKSRALEPIPVQDEYEHYCAQYPDNDGDVANPIQWWIDHQRRYPNLAKLAFDVLSIPAMSAECERVFSSASHLLSDNRNNIDAKTIEACECQRQWIINNFS